MDFCYFNLSRGVKGVDKGKLLDTVVAQEEASKDQDNLRQNNTKIAFYKYCFYEFKNLHSSYRT